MIKTITFSKNSDGKYEGSFDSDSGVLQVDREKTALKSVLKVYTNIEGMTPIRRLHTTLDSVQVELNLPTGMKVVIVSETPVKLCKFVTNG